MGKRNLLNLLKREGIERAECYFTLCPSLEAQMCEHVADVDYKDYFGFSMRYVGQPVLCQSEFDPLCYYSEVLKEGTCIDRWGVAHCPGSEEAMHMTQMLHPLSGSISMETLENYPYPDFATADYSQIEANVKSFAERDIASFAKMSDMVWEISWYLRSMEDLMMDMAVDDEKAVYILDKATELACVRVEKYAALGVDILHTGDDVGMQQNMMFSVEFWQKWLKPRMAKVVETAKDTNPNILFSYHSCGFIEPIIDDLIEIGVDVLNPVQPECMDFEEIHNKYGNKISFWGTIGTQTTMPFGSPDDVRREVLRNLDIAGKKGGLLCTPSHLLEPEVPLENILSYVKACRDWESDVA